MVAPIELEPGEVRLHASWLAGRIVVWAAGPGVPPADGDELADRLEAAGAPAHGWDVHPMVPLPSGEKAEARVIPVHDVLGWLVAIGAGQVGAGESGGDIDEHVGASLRWFGRIAVWAVQLLARGSLVPVLRTRRALPAGAGDAGVLQLAQPRHVEIFDGAAGQHVDLAGLYTPPSAPRRRE